MIALVVETVFLGAIWGRQFSPRKAAAVFVVFCAITALLLAWVAPQQVGDRITDAHDPARLLILRDGMRMFADHPILGSGCGTFTTVFPHYRMFYDRMLINHAHDDFLEVLLETGLLGFAAALWFLWLLYRCGFHNVRRASHSPHAIMSTAALAGCTGLLAHSFTDFNLHLPANAALFFVLCAVATASGGEAQRIGQGGPAGRVA
jgi:O-antigen ligase